LRIKIAIKIKVLKKPVAYEKQQAFLSDDGDEIDHS